MRQRRAEKKYSENGSGKRLPGRPRSEQARLAILRSTLKLLGENGFSDLTIEEVAGRAAVGKATVYRWWPNKGALIADAFASSTKDKSSFSQHRHGGQGHEPADAPIDQSLPQPARPYRLRHSGGRPERQGTDSGFPRPFLWPGVEKPMRRCDAESNAANCAKTPTSICFSTRSTARSICAS